MDKHGIKDIIILGGGTAGWMTANLMAKRWGNGQVNITLVESPDIGIIGVGEGSTPKLKDFFDTLGIEESEWMPECNATYKNGITFKDWSTIPGFDEYFHPFGCTIDVLTFKLFKANVVLRRKGIDVYAHPNRFFLMASLSDKKLAPIAHENFPFQFDYAYHFDSVLVGKFLQKRAIANGVKHIEGTVKDVQLHENGDIASITLADNQSLSADFFVDCTGFASVLLQRTLKVAFRSFSENLFNDAAVAMPTPITANIPSQTISTALANGWAWEIPLTNRFGHGYVYSSSHCSADEAETELRTRLGLLDSDVEARHIGMRVGRVDKCWVKNCVSIGLSQGFIEPLEATALQFVYTTIEEFMGAFEFGGFTNEYQDSFNQRINLNFEGIRDYIVLHYKTNSRNDSEYWKQNRENTHISSNLQSMLDCWYEVHSLEEELQRLKIGNYYTTISWNCLLAGMGLFAPQDQLTAPDDRVMQADLDYVDDFVARCTMNFDAHEKVLARHQK